MIEPPTTMPRTNADPFARAWIAGTPDSDAALGAQGPAVWLDRYDCAAVSSFALARAILPDWRRFTSTAKPFDDDVSLVVQIMVTDDPPVHTHVRDALMRFLSPAALAPTRAMLVAAAERLVDRLIERGSIDAVADLAAAYVLEVFPDLIGLPGEGRHLILAFGEAGFNSVGPLNDIFHESLARAGPSLEWVDRVCRRGVTSPDGLAARIFTLADEGVVTIDQAELLVRTLLAAGFDTTVLGIANAIAAFCRFPDEWRQVHADPALVRGAFEEVLRYDPPARVQGRTATQDVEVQGVAFRRGDPVALFLTAAGRDPARWDEPDRFSVTRRGANLGFGAGIHICIGQVLARMEFDSLFGVLARRVRAIEPTAPPTRFINNAALGWSSVPVRLVAA